MNRANNTKGFTLIEVLVTLLILSVGLLGLAALQATGLRYNQSAYLRSQASTYAYSILDAMRANRDVAENNGYNITFGSTPSSANCIDANCDESAMANFDLTQWKNSISTTLPNGDGQIATASVAGGTVVTVSIRWNDDRENPTVYTTMSYEAEL